MKLNKLSLKWKLFFAVIIFALVIVCIFIVFQIGMLGNFYRTRKIKKTTALVNEVSNIVASHEAVEFSQKIEVDGVASRQNLNYLIGKPCETDIETFVIHSGDKIICSGRTGTIVKYGTVSYGVKFDDDWGEIDFEFLPKSFEIK